MAGPLHATIATARRLSRAPMMHLKTSSFGFAIWWVVLLLLHAVNGGYYVGAAMLYRYMRWTNVDFQLTTYSIGISPTQYYSVSKIHWVIAALHGLFILAMVLGSIQERRLVFVPRMPPWLARIRAKVPSIAITSKSPKPPSDKPERLGESMTRRMSSFSEYSMLMTGLVFGREGLLGVDSVYFDHLLLARELLETTLQTIQCYRMSYLLPRVWLIRFYVVLLIANCWSMPIVHRYYRNRHTQRRMMSLLCDAVLDMVSSVGVSFWIFATYLPQYTDPAFGFPFENWFNDVWFTNMQQEFQMMLVASWADMASRLVFAGGLIQCMEAIKEMLTPPVKKTPSRALVDKRVAAAVVIPSSATDGAARDPSGTEKDAVAREPLKITGPTGSHVDPAKPKKANTSKWSRAVHFLLEKVGPAFFIVLGGAILVVHIVSETRQLSAHIPCQVKLHPWFVSKPACSLVELDCHQLGGLSGSQESMKDAWTTYEFGATARVFVRHCPQLEIPATIQQFRQLTSLKLYNTTIAAWPVEAAFTEAAHAKMRALFAIRTNFPIGELPPGLLSPTFPKGLLNFVTCSTNIQSLPDNLHELWPPVMALSFELSPLQVVPPTLTKMNPMLVAFTGSPIATVPPEIFEGPSLECVLLGFTNVQELPRVVASPSPTFYLLFLEGTNVSTFWSWMDPFVQNAIGMYSGFAFFIAGGSRFCAERDAIVAGNRTSFSITTTEPGVHDLASVMDVSTPERLQFSQTAVLCEPGVPFYFPLEIQDATAAVRT